MWCVGGRWVGVEAPARYAWGCAWLGSHPRARERARAVRRGSRGKDGRGGVCVCGVVWCGVVSFLVFITVACSSWYQLARRRLAPPLAAHELGGYVAVVVGGHRLAVTEVVVVEAAGPALEAGLSAGRSAGLARVHSRVAAGCAPGGGPVCQAKKATPSTAQGRPRLVRRL